LEKNTTTRNDPYLHVSQDSTKVGIALVLV